jgi:AraC family transcriptional regulator
MIASARIVRYAPYAILPRHRHDAPRLCVVVAGRFDEDEDGRSASHRAGRLLYRPADVPHSQQFHAKGAICALITPGASWIEAARERRIDLSAPISFKSPEVERLGLAVRRECARPDEYSALACEAAAWECLALLGRSPRDGKPIAAALARSIEFLRDNPAAPIGVARLAEIAGIHPSTLSRQFRRAFGESVGEHVRRLRVERAAALLRDTDIPIAEIALICGFSSQAHLTTLLRRATGITPGRLRVLRRS